MENVIEMKSGQSVRLGKRTQTSKPVQLGIVHDSKSGFIETVETDGFWAIEQHSYEVDQPVMTLVTINAKNERSKHRHNGKGEVHDVYVDGVLMGAYRVYYIQHYQVHYGYGFTKANRAGDGEGGETDDA